MIMESTYGASAFEEENGDDVVARFGLPELPDPVEDPDEYEDGELAQLAISQYRGERIYLNGYVTVADAQEYCSRDDTHNVAAGWFVMFYRR